MQGRINGQWQEDCQKRVVSWQAGCFVVRSYACALPQFSYITQWHKHNNMHKRMKRFIFPLLLLILHPTNLQRVFLCLCIFQCVNEPFKEKMCPGVNPDFRWWGWSNREKNQNPKKSLGLQTTASPPPPPKKISLDKKLTPKKNSKTNFWA